MEDRALRSIVTGLGDAQNAPVRETGFDIVAASEIMAVLALSSDLEDLRNRLGNIVVGLTNKGEPITSNDVSAVGSMMSLLRYAIQPNLVQTMEGQPVLVHTHSAFFLRGIGSGISIDDRERTSGSDLRR